MLTLLQWIFFKGIRENLAKSALKTPREIKTRFRRDNSSQRMKQYFPLKILGEGDPSGENIAARVNNTKKPYAYGQFHCIYIYLLSVYLFSAYSMSAGFFFSFENTFRKKMQCSCPHDVHNLVVKRENKCVIF